MNQNSKVTRILSIAPSRRGFGFAVLEDETLIAFATRTAEGDKNGESLRKVEKLILQYQPSILTSEDTDVEGSRRHPRIQRLIRGIRDLGKEHKVKVVLLSRDQVKRTFFEDGKGTKQDIAGLMAEWFPEELAERLPSRRKAWQSEKRSMDMFDAVAFAVALTLNK